MISIRIDSLNGEIKNPSDMSFEISGKYGIIGIEITLLAKQIVKEICEASAATDVDAFRVYLEIMRDFEKGAILAVSEYIKSIGK